MIARFHRSLVVLAVVAAFPVLATPVLAAPPAFTPLVNPAATEPLPPAASALSVTPTGEAVWTLPLWTPQGRNGIEPRLSLSYRSRGSNGIVGLRFSVNGLSSITRCWSTIAQDGGYSAGTTRGLPDKFCLDGQRLIPRAGGAQGELQPEFDRGTLVRAGTPASDPASFTVFYRDGRIARFGSREGHATAPSNSILQGRPLTTTNSQPDLASDLVIESNDPALRRITWFLDRLEDRYGNFLEVDYERTTSTGVPQVIELVPKELRWTGFTPPAGSRAVAALPSRRVEFVYAQLPKRDVREGYQGGLAVRQSRLLEKIQVFARDGLVTDLLKNERLFSEYRFAYKGVAPGVRSTDRLESLTECVYATVTMFQCLDPVTFSWSQDVAVPQFAPAVQLTDPVDIRLDRNLNLPRFAADVFDMGVGDFDGDGRDDVVYRLPNLVNGTFRAPDGTDPTATDEGSQALGSAPANTVGRGDWFMRRGTASGLGPRFAVPSLPSTPGGDWKFTPRVLDVDGDGSAEIVLYSEPIGVDAGFSSKRYQIFRSSCTVTNCSFAPLGSFAEITDFPLLSGFPRRSFALQTGDLNGDGKIDFIHENASALQTGGDPTTLSFLAGMPGPAADFAPKVTIRVPAPPPSNGNVVTRLFDERHMVDTDGNGQAELLTLIDAAIPASSPRPFMFTSLTVTGSGGVITPFTTSLHAADVEASDAVGTLLGHPACLPPGDPTLHGMATSSSGQRFRQYTRLTRFFVDVNGDGLRDSVATTAEPRDRCRAPTAIPSILFVSLNTGSQFRKPFAITLPAFAGFNGSVVDFSSGPRSIDNGVRVVDLDGDGRDDFVLVSESEYGPMGRQNMVWLQSTGSGYIPHDLGIPVARNTLSDMSGGKTTYGPRMAQVGDFNGDGLADILKPDGLNFVVMLQRARTPDLVTGIAGGSLTPAREIMYARAAITEPEIYTKGQCAWPQSCQKSMGWVVKSTSVEADFNSVPAVRNFTSYRYENARMDLLGRGMLGVDKFIRTAHDGAVARKVFSTETLEFDHTTTVCQDAATRRCTYLHAGAPMMRTVETPISASRKVVVQTRNLPTLVASPGGSGYRQTRFVSSTLDHEIVTGVPVPRMVRGTRTTTAYDVYGNATSTLSEISGSELPIDGSVQANQVVHAVEQRSSPLQTADESRWLVSRYRDFQVISSVPTLTAQPQLTRTEHVEYEADSVEVRSLTTEPTPPVPESPTTSSFTLTATYTRNERGSVTSIAHAGSTQVRSRTFEFHANDRDWIYPVSARDGFGHTTFAYSHAALGLIVATDDANAVRTSYDYDALGRIRAIHPAGSASINYLYLKRPGSSVGGARSFSACSRTATKDSSCKSMDPAGRIDAVRERGLDSVVFTYDRFGRLMKQSLPFTEFERDGLGRQTALRRRGFNATTTDYDGFRVSHTDERSALNLSDFDFSGRLTRQSIIEPGTQRNVVTGYEYGHFSRLLRILHPVLPASQSMTPDPGPLITTISYDLLGRVESITDPDAGTQTRRYNAFGDVKRQQDANGSLTVYDYDGLGRLERISTAASAAYPARQANGFAQLTQITYDSVANGIDKVGRVRSNDWIVQDFEYDSFGREKRASWTVPGQGRFEFSYDYDALGQLQYLTYPGQQPLKVKYAYGLDGRVSEISNVTDPAKALPIWRQIAIGPLGNSTEEQFGTTVHVRRKYDDAHRLKYVWGEFLPSGEMFQQLTYRWNGDGTLRSRLDLQPTDGVAEAYGHDFLSRLERWTVQQNCLTTDWKYAYDDLGNLRARETLAGVSFPGDVFKYTLPAVSQQPHSVKEVTTGSGTAATSVSLAYDSSGNTSNARGVTFTWAPIGLPWRIADANGVQQVSLYDGSGSRIVNELQVTQVPQAPRLMQRSITLAGLYEMHFFGNSQLTEHVFNVMAPDGIVAQVRRVSNTTADVTRFIHRDHLGNADAITTETEVQGKLVGSLLERRKYEPFGERRHAWALAHPMRLNHAPGTSQGFTGHEPDDAMGLINMRGRVYDPRHARFLSTDPLSPGLDSQSFNRYSYVWNSPVNFIDPSGYEGEQPNDIVDCTAPCYFDPDVGSHGAYGLDITGGQPRQTPPPAPVAETDENSRHASEPMPLPPGMTLREFAMRDQEWQAQTDAIRGETRWWNFQYQDMTFDEQLLWGAMQFYGGDQMGAGVAGETETGVKLTPWERLVIFASGLGKATDVAMTVVGGAGSLVGPRSNMVTRAVPGELKAIAEARRELRSRAAVLNDRALQLGGTVRIGKRVGLSPEVANDRLAQELANLVREQLRELGRLHRANPVLGPRLPPRPPSLPPRQWIPRPYQSPY